jgi:hypothetical protein
MEDETLPVSTNLLTILMDLDECLAVGSDTRDYNTHFQFLGKSYDWQVDFSRHLLNPEAISSLQYMQSHLKPGVNMEVTLYTSKGNLVPIFWQTEYRGTQHVKVPGDLSFATWLEENDYRCEADKTGVARVFYIRDAFAKVMGLDTPPTMVVCAHMMPYRACTKIVHHAAWMLGRHPESCVLFDNTKVYADLTEFNPLGSVIHIEDFHYLGPEQAKIVREIFLDEVGDQRPPEPDEIDPSLAHLYKELWDQTNIQCGCFDKESDRIIIEEAPIPSWEEKVKNNPRIMRFLTSD